MLKLDKSVTLNLYMKKTRLAESQIIVALKEHEAGKNVLRNLFQKVFLLISFKFFPQYHLFPFTFSYGSDFFIS